MKGGFPFLSKQREMEGQCSPESCAIWGLIGPTPTDVSKASSLNKSGLLGPYPPPYQAEQAKVNKTLQKIQNHLLHHSFLLFYSIKPWPCTGQPTLPVCSQN